MYDGSVLMGGILSGDLVLRAGSVGEAKTPLLPRPALNTSVVGSGDNSPATTTRYRNAHRKGYLCLIRQTSSS